MYRSVAQGVGALPSAGEVHAVGAVHWPVNGGGSHCPAASISQHISEYSQAPQGLPGPAALSQHFLASSSYLGCTPSISLSEFVSYLGAPVAAMSTAIRTK